jgi:uncharacterized protein YndB with AHSA1/START domain
MTFRDSQAAVRCLLKVPLPLAQAYMLFTADLGKWWPRPLTWSQESLEAIGMELHANGFCYERGPYGFQCCWGRVLAWQPPFRLKLAWQISPRRLPEPNPDKASSVEIFFKAEAGEKTLVTLEHQDFEKHGKGWEEYREAMASSQGWPQLLRAYARTAEALSAKKRVELERLVLAAA